MNFKEKIEKAKSAKDKDKALEKLEKDFTTLFNSIDKQTGKNYETAYMKGWEDRKTKDADMYAAWAKNQANSKIQFSEVIRADKTF